LRNTPKIPETEESKTEELKTEELKIDDAQVPLEVHKKTEVPVTHEEL
jgi:hypothetical protein